MLTILATGVNITTSGVSAGATLPLNTAGVAPSFIRVAATAAAYIRIGTGAQTAVNTDMMLSPGEAVVLSTGKNTHIAALQVTAAGVVQVSPVEDVTP